jgi:hypothetical protein
MDIKFFNHKDLDLKKWDNTIENSVNGLVYASSWYLDIVNPNWSALIAGDYEIVMPLTIKRKYGIHYLYKSFFSQFLGVFYKDDKQADFVEDFLFEAAKYFKFIEISINVHNSNFEADYCSVKQTQVLSLSGSYESIKSNYKKSNRQNIKKANNEDLIIKCESDYTSLLELVRLMYTDKQVRVITEKDYSDFVQIIKYAIDNNLGEIHYAYHNGKICTAAFFLKWKDRIISLQTGINEVGKNTRALFKIFDDLIMQNAESDMILDFAGSNIKGVAYWNMGFGAKTQHYYFVKINNLPKALKWIKE